MGQTKSVTKTIYLLIGVAKLKFFMVSGRLLGHQISNNDSQACKTIKALRKR